MRSASSLVGLGLALALGAGQVVAATQQEEDSVYEYGRWAVLSPAAGVGEPYIAALTPDAANNLRPEEGFSPVVLSSEPVPQPPVVTDPRDRLPPQPPPVVTDPRDRLPPR